MFVGVKKLFARARSIYHRYGADVPAGTAMSVPAPIHMTYMLSWKLERCENILCMAVTSFITSFVCSYLGITTLKRVNRNLFKYSRITSHLSLRQYFMSYQKNRYTTTKIKHMPCKCLVYICLLKNRVWDTICRLSS